MITITEINKTSRKTDPVDETQLLRSRCVQHRISISLFGI